MKLEKSIACNSLKNFRLVLKKLASLGYVADNGADLDTFGMSEYTFNRGIRIINLYDNKTTKYAVSDSHLKNVIEDVEFLK